MMGAADRQFEGMVTEARRLAALMISFDPARLVFGGEKAIAPNAVAGARVLAFLREDCAEDPARAGHWIMRHRPRHKVFEGMARRKEPAARIEARHPEVEADLVAAFDGTARFAPDAVRALATNRAPGRAEIDRVAHALDRVGPAAPAFELLVPLRSTLNRLDERARLDDLLAPGFFGRKEELEALLDWCAQPRKTRKVRAFFAQGLPGVGKSYLLSKALHQLLDARLPPIVIRLDFDRRGLNTLEQDTLTSEISRQLGDAVPEMAVILNEQRLKLRRLPEVAFAQRTQLLPAPLIDAMAEAVAMSNRRVLVILDTLEMLRSRGETHPMRLFELLDTLQERGVQPITVVAAGRGDALDPVPDRIGRKVVLKGLSKSAARAYLESQGVPERWWDEIHALADGNPLVLRLAAKLSDDRAREEALRGEASTVADPAVVGAYLYRAILSRIEPMRLAKLAHPGLILNRISAAALREVVAPAIGMSMAPDEEFALFDALCSYHWLVLPDGEGWVTHRSDVRLAVLPMIYKDPQTEAQAHSIDLRAAEWFNRQGDLVSGLYHELQATRDQSRTPPPVDPWLAQDFTREMIDELPPHVRSAVLQARGTRSEASRVPAADRAAEEKRRLGTQGRDDIDPLLAQDLLITLDHGDVVEATDIISRIPDWRHLDPRLLGGEAAMAYAWFSGQWSRAHAFRRRLPAVERRARMAAGDVVSLAALEMEAEFSFTAAFRQVEDISRAIDARARGERVVLSGGALDVALAIRLREQRERPPLGPADALLAPYGIVPSGGFADPNAVAERYGIGPEVEVSGLGPIHRLNPYTQPLIRRAEARDSPTLDAWLGRLMESANLPDLVDLLGNTDMFDDWNAYSDPAVLPELLGAFGMTAQWVGGFAFFHRVRGISRIARSAERWRRTGDGWWSFGPPGPLGLGEMAPSMPRSPEGDRGIARQLRRLLSGRDPTADAARLLGHLAGQDGPVETGRLGRVLEVRGWPAVDDLKIRQGVEPEPHALCRALCHGKRFPLPVAAALAVLATR